MGNARQFCDLPRRMIFLALGSNLGDREMNLVEARDLLMKHDVLVLGQSEVRETVPLGGLDQPMYLNQVVEVRTELSPEDLLRACKAVEKEMGREDVQVNLGNVQFGSVKEKKWESRIIDVDILYMGDLLMDVGNLVIPHLGAASRDFNVQGMCDLAPDFMDPQLKKTMREVLESL